MINRPSIAGRLAVSALMSLVLPTACWAQAPEGSNSLFQKFGQLRWNATNHATDPIEVAGYSNSSAFNANANSLNGFSDYNSSDSPFTTSGPIMYVGNYGSTFTELSATALNLQGGAPSLGDVNTAFGAVVGTGFDMGALTVLDAALTTFTASNANLANQTAEVQDTIRIINAGVYPAGGFADASAAQAGLTDSFNTLSTAAIALGVGTGPGNQSTEPSNIDRYADDLNGNGNTGVISVIGTVDGVQTVVGQIIDTGDLHTFNVFFDTVYARREQTFTSFEVMKQHVFYASPGENTATTGWRFDAFWDDWALGFGDEVRGNHAITLESVELFSHDLLSHDWLRDAIDATQWSTYGTAGLRGMRIEDDFFFDGRGSILGRTSVATMIDHDIFGPQLGVGVVAEASMFRFEALLLGLVGYGNVETKQVGIFGEELIPGALNRPATARTTMSAQKTDEEYFAWHGETRITGSCQLTQNLRFDATWRGILAGPVRSAVDSTVWSAPDFGIAVRDGDTVDLSHWFFGLTYTH